MCATCDIGSLFNPDPYTDTEPVQVSRSRGGTCHHCKAKVKRGDDIWKMVPQCCDIHGPHSKSKGGRGSWVCTPCSTLVAK